MLAGGAAALAHRAGEERTAQALLRQALLLEENTHKQVGNLGVWCQRQADHTFAFHVVWKGVSDSLKSPGQIW